MIMGVAGLAMAAVWYVFYRNPSEVALTAEETAYRTHGDPPGQRTVVTLREWKQLFRFRTTWGMILGYFGCIYLTWIYTAWLPGYLEIERHMSVKFTGFAAAIPFVFGVVGGVLGGYLADILVRRGVSPVKSRRYPATIALCGTAVCTLAAAFVTSNALAIAFISASLFLPLRHQHLRLGAELSRRPDKLHRVDRRHAELRRLSWRARLRPPSRG